MADEHGGNAGTVEDKGQDGTGGQPGKVTFTPEQQEHINSLIGKKYAEAFSKAESKADEVVSALKRQIAELQSGKGNGKDDKGEDLSALKERLAAMEQREKQSQERERRAEILTMAAEMNAVSGEQVAMLVAPYIKVDSDGKLSVVNVEGQTRFNSSGHPMAVKEFVSEFLNGNPHLVKAGGGTGAGSRGAGYTGGNGGPPKIKSVEDARTMPIEDLHKALKSGLSFPGGAGQLFHFRKS